MTSQNLIFGIDLGTTYSSIGLYDPETHKVEVAMFNCENGSKLLPSAVYIESPDNIVVGSTAINAGAMDTERLFRWFKRDLGTTLSDRTVDGKLWTPVELSAEIFKALKREAEIIFGTEVKDVVITYPAFFNPQQRDLTKDAAVIAGLNVVRMCEEPHAAAMAYVIEEVLKRAKDSGEEMSRVLPQYIEELCGEQTGSAVLVYDLGGGTFDVAMVQAEGKPTSGGQTELHFKTVFNDGNIYLGGKNWDEYLRQLVADKDQELNQHDPMSDAVMGMFDDYVEMGKRNLSKLESTDIFCPKHHAIKVTRQEANQRTEPLVQKTRDVIENVIHRAITEHHISKDRISLLIAGGMCNWPAVQTMLSEVMEGRPPRIHKTLDYLVVTGAAYLGYLSGYSTERVPRTPTTPGEPPGPDVITTKPADVGGITLGSDAFEGRYPAVGVEVVDANDPMFKIDPSKASKFVRKVIPTDPEVKELYKEGFATTVEGQTSAAFVIYFLKDQEGHKDDETDLAAWQKYRTFTLNFPPKPQGEPLYTDLCYTEGGVVEGKAYDDEDNEILIDSKTSRPEKPKN